MTTHAAPGTGQAGPLSTRLASHPHRRRRGPGILVLRLARRVRTPAADTSPAIIEMTVSPDGGAPLHVHPDLDDSFYLLDGQLAMRCGEHTFVARPGDYVVLPRGVPHTFRVLGSQPARMLQVHQDDSFLRFIRAVGIPAATAQPAPRHAAERPHGRHDPHRRRDWSAGHRAAHERRGSPADSPRRNRTLNSVSGVKVAPGRPAAAASPVPGISSHAAWTQPHQTDLMSAELFPGEDRLLEM